MRTTSALIAIVAGTTMTIVAPAASESKRASVTELKIAKTSARVIAFGTVSPPRPNGSVVVRLARDTGEGYVRVSRTRADLSDARDEDGDGRSESHFETRFRRPQDGNCRVVVVFRGDVRTQASRDEHDFACAIPNFDSGTGTITSDNGVVTVRLLIADTDETRTYGLMYRRSLAADKGMAFLWPSDTSGGFWMKNTLIPLSIAFFDETGQILRILDMEPCEADPCPTYDPEVSYRGALEVNQGSFADWGVDVGDVIQITR